MLVQDAMREFPIMHWSTMGASFRSGTYIRLGEQCSDFSPEDKGGKEQSFGGRRDSGAGASRGGGGWFPGSKVTERQRDKNNTSYASNPEFSVISLIPNARGQRFPR